MTLLVAPHAGAWIEMRYGARKNTTRKVAPHAGAWIEIPLPRFISPPPSGRAPRGRVD